MPTQDATAFAKEGIRINAICPGYVKTNLVQNAANASLSEEFKKIPMGRLAQIEEIADSIVFLASPMSSYMTGATLVVDGYVPFNPPPLLVARSHELKRFLTGDLLPFEAQCVCVLNPRNNGSG